MRITKRLMMNPGLHAVYVLKPGDPDLELAREHGALHPHYNGTNALCAEIVAWSLDVNMGLGLPEHIQITISPEPFDGSRELIVELAYNHRLWYNPRAKAWRFMYHIMKVLLIGSGVSNRKKSLVYFKIEETKS